MALESLPQLTWWERVDVWRRHSGHSIDDVAMAAGVSRVHLYRLADPESSYQFTEGQQEAIEALVTGVNVDA